MQRQLDDLACNYVDHGRDVAIDHLVDSIEQASARYLANRGLFYDAPRRYPNLLRRSWRWTKERYSIAFGPAKDGAIIRAIFYESANMPERL